MGYKIAIAIAIMLLPHSDIKQGELVTLALPSSLKANGDLEEIRQNKLELEIRKAKKRLAVKEQAKKVTEFEKNLQALVRATFRLETGNGTSQLWLKYNNAGGIKCGGEYCEYSNGAEGMQHLENLLRKYVEKFGFNLKAIRDVYSESDDTKLFTEIYNNERGE